MEWLEEAWDSVLRLESIRRRPALDSPSVVSRKSPSLDRVQTRPLSALSAPLSGLSLETSVYQHPLGQYVP